MNNTVPSVTVLIAARPEQAEIKAVIASRALDYPADKLQIIVARGKQPSIQRNAGIKAARGELIYFLDDDSVCPADAPRLEQVFALVLGSWLAFGPSRARYTSVGDKRETSEKEIILCNLLARRDVLLQLGGFNEALYPNEENALMDEVQKGGGKLIYDPEFVVYRRPRASLWAFAKMLRTYGRGRAEQFRLHPTAGSALNFVPPLFCLYLGLLVVLLLVPVPAQFRMVILAPLALYGLVVLAQVLVLAANHGVARSFLTIPLIVLSHVLYGLGFWHGLVTTLKPPEERATQAQVVIETVPLRPPEGPPPSKS